MANNSSGNSTRSEFAWKAQAWGKMAFSPDLPIPVFGGKRYVHLREAFIHPNAQEALKLDDDTIAVSRITLMAMYNLLHKYNLKQRVAAYVVKGDPADVAFDQLTQSIGMTRTDGKPNTLSGYDENALKVRLESGAKDIQRAILDMPSARV